MKKILPYIFILTIVVQFFAPFSVEVDNKAKIIKNTLSAEYAVKITNAKVTREDNTVSVEFEIEGDPYDTATVGLDTSAEIEIFLKTTLYDYEGESKLYEKKTTYEKKKDSYSVELSGGKIKSEDEYSLEIALWKSISLSQPPITPGDFPQKTKPEESLISKTTVKTKQGVTQEIDTENLQTRGALQEEFKPNDDAFDCRMGNLRGCFAEFAYTIIFKPSAFLFGLTGKALDFTLMYSLDDKSYRSVFVVEGWGIVRDICNLFFIFILLYIAFKVVLGLGSGKSDPKSLIINVIIIGLLINFSLFATRLIIDASNILSRVFYNSETISFKSSSGTDTTLGSAGEIKFSEVLVQKVNPVSLLTQSGNIGYLGEKSENMTEALTEAERDQNIGSTVSRAKQISDDIPVGLGTFVIICFLTAGICIIGIVVFFNLTFVFIARVVMLWLAMILSPLAFFSHTTPELENLKFIGFRNWLKETASMAFVAPIFCFFLYIIITFLDSGLGITDAYRSPTGFEFVLRILIPFLFLSVLLMKAKDIAISMSGQAGKFVSDMGNKIAGTTIGLATGGAAMAMRGTIGAMGTKIAGSKGLTDLEENGNMAQRFLARNARNVGISLGSKSFDFRNTTIGEKAASGLGISGSVKKTMASGSKPGVGFLGNQEEKVKKVEKRQADLDKLKPKTENEKKREGLDRQQAELEVKISPVLEQAEKERDEAKEKYAEEKENRNEADKKLKDAEKELEKAKGTASEEAAQQKVKEAEQVKAEADKKLAEADKKLETAKNNVSDIKNGAGAEIKDGKIEIKLEEGSYNTSNKNISQKLAEEIGKRYEKAENRKNSTSSAVASIDNSLNKAMDEKKRLSDIDKLKKEDDKEVEDKVQKVKSSFATAIGEAEAEKKKAESELGRLRLAPSLDEAAIKQAQDKVTQHEDKIKKLKDEETKTVLSTRIEAEKEVEEKRGKRTEKIKQLEGEIKSLGDAKKEAVAKNDEAEKEFEVASVNFESVQNAKKAAEKNGGYGKSLSETRKESTSLSAKIKQEQDQEKLVRAKNWEGGTNNLFDYLSHGRVSDEQAQDQANKLYQSINKK
ncbi:MAG TPA: type IV secretion system protein [Candidatus Paceibacterota bacterium]|nr:type IV secretion system protein [Candidatus Paceibacterota bacterium]